MNTALDEALVAAAQQVTDEGARASLNLALLTAQDARTLGRSTVMTPTRALCAMTIHLARANAQSGHALDVAKLADAIDAWACGNDAAAHLALTGGAPLVAEVA